MQLIRYFSGAKSIFPVSIAVLLGLSACLEGSSNTFKTSPANEQFNTTTEQPGKALILLHGLSDLQSQESGLNYLKDQQKTFS